MSESEHADDDVGKLNQYYREWFMEWKNENLIEFTTKTVRTNNLSSNQNLIVVESMATEPWKMIIIIHIQNPET